MKWLCCNQSFADQFFLKEHYLTCPNVDESNCFFGKLFTRDKFFVPRKWFHCDYICLNRRDEKNHNFLTHYQMGGRQSIEDKPLKKHFLIKIWKDTALIFLNMVTIMIFMTHQNYFLIFWWCLKMSLFHSPFLGGFASSVHL